MRAIPWTLMCCLAAFPAPRHAAAGGAAAQAASPTPQPPQPYQPTVGQPGKDVVWVPTADALVEKMLDLARVTPQDYVIDLGSGDGRTVIAAARRGARARGIEFNPDLVELSRQNAEKAGVSARASFVEADIFKSDFSQASVVTMFLLPSLNLQLRPTILSLKPGTRIVSNSFGMDDWQPDDQVSVGEDCASWCTAMFWIVPAKVEGTWRMPQGLLTLQQRFQMISGTLGETPIAAGRLRGDAIEFKVGDTLFTGRVAGGVMKGMAGGAINAAWTATRE
jgi:SAM-dependent methyltransferase